MYVSRGRTQCKGRHDVKNKKKKVGQCKKMFTIETQSNKIKPYKENIFIYLYIFEKRLQE